MSGSVAEESKKKNVSRLLSPTEQKQIIKKLHHHVSRFPGVLKATIDDWFEIAETGIFEEEQLRSIYSKMAYLINFFAVIFVRTPDDPSEWEKIFSELATDPDKDAEEQGGLIPSIKSKVIPLLVDELKIRDKSQSAKLLNYFFGKEVTDLVDKVRAEQKDLSDKIFICRESMSARTELGHLSTSKNEEKLTELCNKNFRLVMALTYLDIIRSVLDQVYPEEDVQDPHEEKAAIPPIIENIKVYIHQVSLKLLDIEFWIEKIAFLSAVTAYVGALAALGLLGSKAIVIGIVILGITALLWLILIGLRSYYALASRQRDSLLLELAEYNALKTYQHKIERLAKVAYLRIPFEMSKDGRPQLTGESHSLPRKMLHVRQMSLSCNYEQIKAILTPTEKKSAKKDSEMTRRTKVVEEGYAVYNSSGTRPRSSSVDSCNSEPYSPLHSPLRGKKQAPNLINVPQSPLFHESYSSLAISLTRVLREELADASELPVSPESGESAPSPRMDFNVS